MTKGFAFDVQAVCAGFIYALANANALIVSGQARRVLVIGAETFSRIMDWTDRGTCVLFGDGAGALILEAAEGDGTIADRGILSTDLNSDGRLPRHPLCRRRRFPRSPPVSCGCRARKSFAMPSRNSLRPRRPRLKRLGLTGADVDWIVPHQANIRIIQGTAKKLGLSMERVVVTVQDHGNTSAASIPLALSVGKQRGQIKRGDLVVTEAIGGGLAWGAVVLRW